MPIDHDPTQEKRDDEGIDLPIRIPPYVSEVELSELSMDTEYIPDSQVETWIQEVAQEAADRTVRLMEESRTGTIAGTDESDGLYYKYRVFKEPKGNTFAHPVLPHPVPIRATWRAGEAGGGELEEVQEFTFTLKPDADHHARVALAAYAKSVAQEKPRLHDDLMEVLGDF